MKSHAGLLELLGPPRVAGLAKIIGASMKYWSVASLRWFLDHEPNALTAAPLCCWCRRCKHSPCGLVDKASGITAEDLRPEPCQGRAMHIDCET